MDQILPNFLIVGAKKAGTTSLYAWLRRHPEVFMPDEKEPAYFYPGQNTYNWNQYLSLFQKGNGKPAIGEASVRYLWCQESPALIYEKLGRIKIIIVLRDPVKRAFSLYSYLIMAGLETMDSFEEAIAAEDRRFQDKCLRDSIPYSDDFLYYRTGLYSEQISRYFEQFGKDQVLVLLFDDLIQKSGEAVADVCRFLGIDSNFQCEWTKENPTLIPRFIGIQRRLAEAQSMLRAWGFRGTWRLRVILEKMKQLNWKYGDRPKLSPETENMLRKRFESEVKQLSSLLSRDLAAWLPKS